MLAVAAVVLVAAWGLSRIAPPIDHMEAADSGPPLVPETTPKSPSELEAMVQQEPEPVAIHGVVQRPSVELRAPRTMEQVDLLVTVGDHVVEDQPLVLAMDPAARKRAEERDAHLQALRTRIESAEAKRQQLAAPAPPPTAPNDEELERAHSQLLGLQAERVRKEAHLQRFLDASQEIEVPPLVLRNLRREIATLDEAIRGSQERWDRLQERREAARERPTSPSEADLARLRAELAESEAEARMAHARARMTLRATVAGTVEAQLPPKGDACPAGRVLLRIRPDGDARIVAWPTPERLEEFPVGATVRFRIGEKEYAAEVVKWRAGEKGPEILLRCTADDLADGAPVLILPGRDER